MDNEQTRQLHFTTPWQLEIIRNAGQVKGAPGGGKGNPANFGVKAIQDIFPGGKGVKADGGGKVKKVKGGGKKNKAAGKGKSVLPGPEKRRICYSFNNGQGCDGSCGMAHVCQICLQPEHGKNDCPTLKNKGQ
jgi:hypothetical protein